MLDRVDHSPDLGRRSRGQSVVSGDLLALERLLDATFVRWAQEWEAREYRFPACVEARHLDRLDYFRSFPHLATFPVTLEVEPGNVERFAGGDPVRPDGGVALADLAPVEHVLTPAACYHVYVELEGARLAAPRYVTTRATCFRNESTYAALERQWSFDMREIVCLGTPGEVEHFLECCTDAVDALVARLGLPLEWRNATDPFFSPASNPKHLFQQLEPVKRELVFGGELAIASTNFHRDYFGEAFDIERHGAAASSGCVAFGLERWLAAVLAHFGEARAGWTALEQLAP